MANAGLAGDSKNPQQTKTALIVGGLFAVAMFLIVAVVGILAIGDNNISVRDAQVTNVTDTAFTLTWVSESPYVGSVVYKEGASWPALFAQSGAKVSFDDRDVELDKDGNYVTVTTGAKERFTHHVTIRNLKPETEYSFRVGGRINGKDAEVTTAKTRALIEDIKTPDPGYGKVLNVNLGDSLILMSLMDVEDDTQSPEYISTYLNDQGGYSVDLNLLGNQTDAQKITAFIANGKEVRSMYEFQSDSTKPFETISINNPESLLGMDGLVKGVSAQNVEGTIASSSTGTGDKVNVRPDPSTGATPLGVKFFDEKITIKCEVKTTDPSWYKIDFNGGDGFVRSDFVTVASGAVIADCAGGSVIPTTPTGPSYVNPNVPDPQLAPTQTDTSLISGTSASLITRSNFRTMPNTSGTIRRGLDAGTTVEVVCKVQVAANGYSWYEVRQGGDTGYLSNLAFNGTPTAVECGSQNLTQVTNARGDQVTREFVQVSNVSVWNGSRCIGADQLVAQGGAGAEFILGKTVGAVTSNPTVQLPANQRCFIPTVPGALGSITCRDTDDFRNFLRFGSDESRVYVENAFGSIETCCSVDDRSAPANAPRVGCAVTDLAESQRTALQQERQVSDIASSVATLSGLSLCDAANETRSKAIANLSQTATPQEAQLYAALADRIQAETSFFTPPSYGLMPDNQLCIKAQRDVAGISVNLVFQCSSSSNPSDVTLPGGSAYKAAYTCNADVPVLQIAAAPVDDRVIPAYCFEDLDLDNTIDYEDSQFLDLTMSQQVSPGVPATQVPRPTNANVACAEYLNDGSINRFLSQVFTTPTNINILNCLGNNTDRTLKMAGANCSPYVTSATGLPFVVDLTLTVAPALPTSSKQAVNNFASSLVSKVSAQQTPRSAGAVLGAGSENSAPSVSESGRYGFFRDGARIAEFETATSGQSVTVRLFEDTNGNGVRDGEEKLIEDYSNISLAKEATVESFNLSSGWNLINIPMVDTRADGTVDSAAELINYFNGQGANILHVSRFRNGDFQMYSAREGGNRYSSDFNLIPGEGLFVFNQGSATEVTFSGNRFESSVPVKLNQGWNLVGLMAPGQNLNSEAVLTKAQSQGFTADTISQFEGGTYQSVISKDDTIFGNNFNIVDKRGYFIRVESGGGQSFDPGK